MLHNISKHGIPCFEMVCSTDYLLKLYLCNRLRSQVSVNVSARQHRVHGNVHVLDTDMVATILSRLGAFRFKLEVKR